MSNVAPSPNVFRIFEEQHPGDVVYLPKKKGFKQSEEINLTALSILPRSSDLLGEIKMISPDSRAID